MNWLAAIRTLPAVGPGEMAQGGKSAFYSDTRQDLGLNPQHPCKKEQPCVSVTIALKAREKADSGGSLAGSVSLAKMVSF